MKKTIALLALCAVFMAAHAQTYLTTVRKNGVNYSVVRPGIEQVVDTLKGATPLVLLFERTTGAQNFTMWAVFDSLSATKTASTDTVTASNRCIPRLEESTTTAGSALYPLLWRDASGDTATVLDWAPDRLYFISSVVLDECPYWEITLTGSVEDTIPVRFGFIQGDF